MGSTLVQVQRKAALVVKVVSLLLVAFVVGLNGLAKEPITPGDGHLVIVGGGLRHDNRSVFEQFIALAGGPEQARIVVLPTASIYLTDSQDMCRYLSHYGVAKDRSEVLDVTPSNAATAAHDALIVSKVRAATGVFISGGDQRRLVRLLTGADGSDTPLLAEIRALYARGGVIGGTSAGASCQSATMLAVSGLPDRLLDEGLDALDYGITSDEDQRGLLLTRGFGFFTSGIIDQHFTQFRGRLGRLTRATAESGVPRGFGIDENTALIVSQRGPIRIAGAGMVTIVEPGPDRGKDGPFGYAISGVKISMLTEGDTFEPATGVITIDQAKPELVPEKAEYAGNFLVNDIAADRAVPFALVSGLAENTRQAQEALSQKFHGEWMHGYRFRFRKQATTRAYGGIMNEQWTYSLTNVQLDIAPIANGLRPSASQAPLDVDDDAERTAICAIAFRGILPVDRGLKFRPRDTLTRGEFASALARSAHLLAAPLGMPLPADVDLETFEGEEWSRVLAVGWMKATATGRFEPSEPVQVSDVFEGLSRLIEHSGPLDREKSLAAIKAFRDAGRATASRREVALLLHSILRLPK